MQFVPPGPRSKGRGKGLAQAQWLLTAAESKVSAEMTISTTMASSSILSPPTFHGFVEKLFAKKQRKDSRAKLFIPLHAFEVFDFTMRLRRIESPGNKKRRDVVQVMSDQEMETE